MAKEPEPDPLPSPDSAELENIFGRVIRGALMGDILVPTFSSRFRQPDTVAMDLPLPFGPRIAWLAVEATDTEAVARALGMREARPTTWAEGLDAAHRASVFVTPPLADWTLAVGTPFFPPGRAEGFVKPFLERLSRAFGEAQYFCTHRDLQLHMWARAQKGRLIRGYGWMGEKGLLWDEGAPTKEERDLRFGFSGGLSNPEEASVTQLASLWSVDPTTLDEHFKEPVLGLLGSAPWGER